MLMQSAALDSSAACGLLFARAGRPTASESTVAAARSGSPRRRRGPIGRVDVRTQSDAGDMARSRSRSSSCCFRARSGPVRVTVRVERLERVPARTRAPLLSFAVPSCSLVRRCGRAITRSLWLARQRWCCAASARAVSKSKSLEGARAAAAAAAASGDAPISIRQSRRA